MSTQRGEKVFKGHFWGGFTATLIPRKAGVEKVLHLWRDNLYVFFACLSHFNVSDHQTKQDGKETTTKKRPDGSNSMVMKKRHVQTRNNFA